MSDDLFYLVQSVLSGRMTTPRHGNTQDDFMLRTRAI